METHTNMAPGPGTQTHCAIRTNLAIQKILTELSQFLQFSFEVFIK